MYAQTITSENPKLLNDQISFNNPELDDDGDDDNISLVSRTPSPPIQNTDENMYKYDEYVRGAAREIITVETKIKPSNKGYALLTKLGWKEGQPLGLSGDGRIEPIPFHIKADLTGLGKINQDSMMIETTVSQRRELDSERQQKETEAQRKAREDSVLRRAAVQTEITSMLKPFYCTLCDKQFKTVAQYDEHTNSYAHHHKARLKDMQASQRILPQEEVDKRKEKERRREEKELRKMAAALGVKMAKSVSQATSGPPSSVNDQVENLSASKTFPAKESSAPVSTPESFITQPSFKKTGWSTVGSSPTPNLPGPSRSITAQPASRDHRTPSFRTAGWTSLDAGATGASHPPPPTPPLPDGILLSPFPLPPAQGGNSASGAGPPRRTSRWDGSPPPPPNSTSTDQDPSTRPPSRSSWQHFKQAGNKHRDRRA